MIFRARIEKGKLIPQARTAMEGWIKAQKDGPMVIDIRRPKNSRTNQQNNYYWGVVVDYIAKQLGYEPDEAHEALKWQFLRKPDTDPPTVKSTAKLSTTEFNEYIETVVRWAASYLNIVIPDPE